jgi:hypothetical protein
MEPKQRTFSMWYTVAAMLAVFGMQAILFAPHPENLSYSEFKALLKAGRRARQSEESVMKVGPYAGKLPAAPAGPRGAGLGA